MGKNSTGIVKPLKSSLKFDQAGFGHDRAAEFNDHWWQRCYNDAANNLIITKDDNEKITVNLKDNESIELSTKSYSVKKLKQQNGGSLKFGTFLKTATLTSEGTEMENDEKIDLKDIQMPQVNILTDDELFAACGGLTAHKGARHGLKLSGKLARIAEQEAELLKRMQSCKTDKSTFADVISDEWKRVKSKRNKTKNEFAPPVEYTKMSNKKLKKLKKREAKLKEDDTVMEEVKDEPVDEIKKERKLSKKNKKRIFEENSKAIQEAISGNTPTTTDLPKKSLKRKIDDSMINYRDAIKTDSEKESEEDSKMNTEELTSKWFENMEKKLKKVKGVSSKKKLKMDEFLTEFQEKHLEESEGKLVVKVREHGKRKNKKKSKKRDRYVAEMSNSLSKTVNITE